MTKTNFVSEILPLTEALYKFALWRTKNQEDSEDLVQEVVLRLWVQREKLAELQNIEGFAFKILRNLCIDFLRKKKYGINQSDESKKIFSMNLYLDNKEKLEIIERELKNFSETQQTIFYLRNNQGLEIKEIAAKLDMKKNTVEVNLSRIRTKLLKLLEEKWYGEK